MKPLILSVPNFSEGQRQDLIQDLVEFMARAGGVYVLDVSSDPHQNRTAVALAGLPMEVEKAVWAGIRFAVEHIDMDVHQGSYPRLGAADVIPFTPLRNTTLDDCIKLAHRMGQRIADDLRLPVYFFGAAALRQRHEYLIDICHPDFQYEQLHEHIRLDPAWVPDVGPAELTNAGACLVGAGSPMVECVVKLATSSLEVAQSIAGAVDFASGGLRHVRCRCELVGEAAQLRFYLSNYMQTPLHRVLDLLRREANQRHIPIMDIQLKGLVPENVLLDSAGWYLGLESFDSQQTLDYRLRLAESEPTPLSDEEPPIPEDATSHIVLPAGNESRRPEQFVSAVAGASPTPGGGAVSAQVGALAAALAEMVAGLTIGKKSYQAVEEKMSAIQTAAYHLRNQLLDAVSQDIDAFNKLLEAIRRDKAEPDYEDAIQRGTLATADVPMMVIRLAYEVLELLEQVVEMGNRNAVIDAAVGSRMALAVIEGSALNVRVNLMSITDEDITRRYHDELRHILENAPKLCTSIIQIASQRVGLNEDF